MADYGNNRIQSFSGEGEYVGSFSGTGSLDGRFRNPKGLSVDSNGNIIADSWPTVWGPKILSDIAVLSSYRYQVSDFIPQEKMLIMIRG